MMQDAFRRAAAAACAAALCSTAAAAEVAGDGYISLRGARHKIKVPGFGSETVTGYAIDGAAVFQPGGRYNIQLNGALARFDTEPEDSELFSADAHVFWGPEEKFTFGGFASIFEVDSSNIINETYYGGGLEADFYDPNWTSSIQAGLFYGEDDEEILGLAGQVRLYATPNFSLEGGVAYARSELNGFESDLYGYSAEAEYQFAGTPLSLFAAARRNELDDYIDVEVTTWSLGMRWAFASKSLIERDRHGPSMRGSQKIVELTE